MLCREHWSSLDGTWELAFDDADEGLIGRWWATDAEAPFTRRIEVPFPPESPASGVGERGFHPVVWYRRRVPPTDLVDSDGTSGDGRVFVRFGAVDHSARVWLDGQLVAEHVGGQTPFSADVTEALDPEAAEHVLVVRAEDRPDDVEKPRGKQDWQLRPHGIWYERTSGIWQTVWSETVPRRHVADVAWTPDVAAAVVHAEVGVALPAAPVTDTFVLDLTLQLGDEVLARQSCQVRSPVTYVDVPVPALRNGQDRDRLLWSPEQPRLVDVEVVLREGPSGRAVDRVTSYLGLRSVGVSDGCFLLNGRPYYTRSVLDQGYRPQTHLASHGSDELRAEVEAIKAMGFNAVRVHQKAEDPRFLFWADRLGLLVWGETAGAYAFSTRAVALLTGEWLDLVRRDRSHPCIAVWVPINESWGVQDIATATAQQQLAQSLASLTRAMDPSRPVVSNEGWEHVDSDVLGLHDYTTDPEALLRHYRDAETAMATILSGLGPAGRRPVLSPSQREAFLEGRAPLMITEFGGISLSEEAETWGYQQVASPEEYAALINNLFDALRACPTVVGFCYTQLMDTGQETNGLLLADGTPKLPLERIRRIVTGRQQEPEPDQISATVSQDPEPEADAAPPPEGTPPPAGDSDNRSGS
jgi:beta-galactosidase/beta-glucuronidase